MSTRAKPKAAGAAKSAPAIPTGCEALMSREDIAAALRVSARTLDAMVGAGEYPRPDTHVGRLPRWSVATHDRWVRVKCGKEG